MFSLNFVIGVGALITFAFLFFTEKVEKYLYNFIIFLIIASFIAKIVDFFEPIEGTNFISGARTYLILILFVSILAKNKISVLIKTKLGPFLLLYIFIFTLFMFFSPGDFEIKGKALLSAPLFMSFYFIGLTYFDRESRIKIFFKFIIIFYTLNIIYAIYQQIFGFSGFENIYITSTQGTTVFQDSIDPITGRMYYKVMGFSGFNYTLFYILSMLSIIIISSRKYFSSIKIKQIYYFLFSYLILLFLTLERTPIMMLGVIPIVFIKEKKRLVIYVILIIVFIGLISNFQDQLLYSGSGKLKRFAEIVSPGARGTSLEYRMSMRWNISMPIIFKNPWGIGVGNQIALGAHNNYIKIFLQLGWLGGGLFLFILLKSVSLCYNNYKILKGTKYAPLILGILAASLAMFATGIPNIPFTYDCAIFFWLFLGMVEKLPSIYRKGEIAIK